MASHNRTLQLMATKLGLNEEVKVLNKAAELERLLQTKSTAGANMTDTSKIVICLDLAAVMFGADLDVKSAVKYSGLKPMVYRNCRKTVENLLQLNTSRLNTTVLCLTLQCTDMQSLADDILDQYQKHSKREIDLNLPQYVCMAVYQACRLNNKKVPKSKMIEKSRLKPAQWAKLDAEWTKFVNDHFSAAKIMKKRTKKSTANDASIEKMEVDIPKKINENKPTEPQIESYVEWKRRILEAARKEMQMQQEMEKMEQEEIVDLEENRQKYTPRKSPRKTPQKYAPYTSPRKLKVPNLSFAI